MSFLCVLISVTFCRGQQETGLAFGSGSLLAISENLRDYKDPVFIFNMPGKIQVYLNEGINFLKEGDYLKSANNLDSAIAADRKLWIAFYYRGIANSFSGKSDDATKDFLSAIEINPNAVEAHIELGRLYAANKATRKATKEFERAADISPNIAEPYFYLGMLQLLGSNLRSANNFLLKSLKVNPKFARSYIVLALLNKNSKEAMGLLTKAIEAEPNFANAYFFRGAHFGALKRYDEGLSDMNRAVTLRPASTYFLYYRIKFNAALKKYDDVLHDVRRISNLQAMSFGPDQAIDDRYSGGTDIFNQYIGIQTAAEFLSRTGYGIQKQAFDLLKESFCELVFEMNKRTIEDAGAANRIEKSAVGFYLKALAFENLKRYDSAFRNYDAALKIDNDIFDAHKKRGYYFSVLKDFKGAYQDLNDMKRLRPSSYMVYRLSGEIKFTVKDYYGCIIDLTRYLKTDSTNLSVLFARATARCFVDDFKGSNEDYIYILKRDPKWKDIYSAIGFNFAHLKDTIAAAREFGDILTKANYISVNERIAIMHHLIDLKMENEFERQKKIVLSTPFYFTNEKAEIIFLDGRIEYLHGEYRASVKKFDAAIKANSDNAAERHYFRGKAHLKLGHVAEAKADFLVASNEGYADAAKIYDSIH